MTAAETRAMSAYCFYRFHLRGTASAGQNKPGACASYGSRRACYGRTQGDRKLSDGCVSSNLVVLWGLSSPCPNACQRSSFHGEALPHWTFFFRSARKIRPVAEPGAHTAAKASWSMLLQLSFCLICWSTLLPPPQRRLPPRSRGCPSGTTTVPSHRLEPSARDSLRTCRHST